MLNYTIYHEAKSKFAYMFDKDTIHLRLITSKDKIHKIEVICGDPFYFRFEELEKDKYIMVKEYETETYNHYFIAIKPKYKRMKYSFIIDDQYLYGSHEIIDILVNPNSKKNLFNFFNFPYLNEEDLFNAPSWVQDQVWYSIFPERFKNGDSSINPENTLSWGETDRYSNSQRFGGDLQGIIDKLQYIKDIGFTGIYMTPIFEADSSHKYDTTNYFKIDKDFGDNEKFKELVEKAHNLGIKVMLDAVFNHSGFRHPFFLDVVKNGKKSKYYDCFYIINGKLPVTTIKLNENMTIKKESASKYHHNPDHLNYRTFAFTPYMPKLNTNNKIMKEHLMKVTKYWIEEYDIDGWRLDVSNEVSHQFWREFRQTVKTLKNDAYIVGENWDNSNPWLQGDQYDGVMNYEILFPIWNYFGTNIDNNPYTSTQFMYKINKVLTDYPKNVLKALYNLVDSHDTTRILEICSNNIELVKLPYLFLFTFPGAPSIYYGGEIGLSGKHDPDNRRCMEWNSSIQNSKLLNHIKKLIKLRNEYCDFKTTDFRWLATNDKDKYIIYNKGTLYFIINNNPNSITISLPLELSNSKFKDIYNETYIEFNDKLKINPLQFYIIEKI